MRRMLNASAGAARLVSASVALTTPSTSHAAQPAAYGRATVTSIDGPGRMTIRARSRRIPVRLFFVDVPQSGECGAPQSTAALRRSVARAPRNLDYELAELGSGQLARDADGRYLATLSYRHGIRNFASDLINADWGRAGEPATLDEPAGDLRRLEVAPDWATRALIDTPRARRGIWALCGGRLHLPAGAAIPTSAAAVWAVDARGITTAVGSLPLPATLTPEGALTLRDVASAWNAEVTRWPGGCRVWFPQLQVRVWVDSDAGPCDQSYVAAIRTTGPDQASLSRGGVGVGAPVANLSPLFPLVGATQSGPTRTLSGPGCPQWAWQTEALISSAGRVDGLATYASPLPPT